MVNTIGLMLTLGALIGLFIVALIAFPALRNAIKNAFNALGKWASKHLLGIILFAIALIALIMNEFTAALLAPFAYLAVIVLGICIMLGAVNKKFSKHAWKIGTVALGIILASVILEKLPW
ncbi:MAG: hypothetical protein E7311_03140 [Clostridiales bacterium]|nr:hypothetical protein [Clostridiales bacterium]